MSRKDMFKAIRLTKPNVELSADKATMLYALATNF